MKSNVCLYVLIILAHLFTFSQVNQKSVYNKIKAEKMMTAELIQDFKVKIKQLNNDMEVLFYERKFTAIADFYAEDAVMLGDKVNIEGRTNIKNYWAKFENSPTTTWDLSTIELKVFSSKNILQRGISKIYYKDKGEIKASQSIFTVIWEKKGDEWKMILDHFSAYNN
jgi:uncharacterized protein (TIGR02246 family)